MMLDKTKPMKFMVDSDAQLAQLVHVLEDYGYTKFEGWSITKKDSVYAWDDRSDFKYQIASVDTYRTAGSVPFVEMDTKLVINTHYTAPAGREVSVEEAMNLMVAAGGTRVESKDVIVPVNASYILQEAADALNNRAAERDHEDGGERSMERCVASFNAMRGHDLSVEDGWLFMVFLKLARSSNGAFRKDDYVDGSAYIALAGEEASK